MEINYPEEWNQLPRHIRRKKVRELRRQKEKQSMSFRKVRSVMLVVTVIALLLGGHKLATRKTPEQIVLGKQVEEVSLDGKVEEFAIEGRGHISKGTVVVYKTNPPTSGDHLAQAESWGVYDKEIEDKSAVHGLEHGGIWISYKDIDEESKKVLEEIGKANSKSVIVSPRSANDANVAVASWGRMMKMEKPDRALIQKYIETYKNQGPEKLAI